MESLSHPTVSRPPTTLLMESYDDDFPNPNVSEGYWLNFIKNRKGGRQTMRSNTLTRTGVRVISKANVRKIIIN